MDEGKSGSLETRRRWMFRFMSHQTNACMYVRDHSFYRGCCEKETSRSSEDWDTVGRPGPTDTLPAFPVKT